MGIEIHGACARCGRTQVLYANGLCLKCNGGVPEPTDRELLDWLDARTYVQPSLHPDHLGETLLSAHLPMVCPTEVGHLRDLLRRAMRVNIGA